MEIHHIKTPRKNFLHYSFEFLMLFVAISLGFYVDNRREHYIEHKREKQYMKMLVEDLKTDIRSIDSNMLFRKKREEKLDRLISLLGQKDFQNKANIIYRLIDSTDGYETFNRDDRTIQQLKAAGGMRMIRNDSVSAAIVDYDNYIITEVDWNNRTEANRIDTYKQLRFQLFDVQALNNMIKGDTAVSFSFLPATPAVVNAIAGAMFQVMRISATNRENGKTVKEKAQQLIELIQRQYSIKSSQL
jgi:hypothetical protein